MAVVTFLPVTPWSHAAWTFKSNLGLPPFWPVLRKYHCSGKYGSVGILLLLSVSLSVSTGKLLMADGLFNVRNPRLTRLKPVCCIAVWIWWNDWLIWSKPHTPCATLTSGSLFKTLVWTMLLFDRTVGKALCRKWNSVPALPGNWNYSELSCNKI